MPYDAALEELDVALLNYWLSRFVMEARRSDVNHIQALASSTYSQVCIIAANSVCQHA